MKVLLTYLRLLGTEFFKPINYLIALFIGLIINLTTGQNSFFSPIPYLVPFLVQSFTKSVFKFKHRSSDMLLQLPGERLDPAFIINTEGLILAATGNTLNLFEKLNIKNINQLLDQELCGNTISQCRQPGEAFWEKEAYSKPLDKWYRIKVKKPQQSREVMVWFEDISERKRLDGQLVTIRNFTQEIISSLPDLVVHDDSSERLAKLILLEGYQGVFITETDQRGHLSGRVYKMNGDQLLISEPIEVPRTSQAPIWFSQRTARVVSSERSDYSSISEFETAHPFDPRVREFLDFSIHSFINYHEGEISIIAFNKQQKITKSDRFSMETIVNTARAVNTLISLSQANEAKFLQSITGLCAAAEFSDEITGQHILRVNRYSELMARTMAMEKNTCIWIGQVAAIHDIGKVAIPHIIKLERKLTARERREMEMHTIVGALILDKMMELHVEEPRMELARSIALNHHQRFDGKGYPGLSKSNGELIKLKSRENEAYEGLSPLKGKQIPVIDLIVSLADIYDALRSKRQYKAPFSHQEALKLIRLDDRSGSTGEQVFSKEVFEAFMDNHQAFDEIFLSMSSNALNRS